MQLVVVHFFFFVTMFSCTYGQSVSTVPPEQDVEKGTSLSSCARG